MNACSPRLLKAEAAAAYCGVPTRTFRKHIGIAPIRIGRYELWDRQKLDAYIDGLQNEKKKTESWEDAVKKF